MSEVIAILYVSAYIFVDLCHDQRHAIVMMSDLFSTNSLNDDIFIVSYLIMCNFILPKSWNALAEAIKLCEEAIKHSFITLTITSMH